MENERIPGVTRPLPSRCLNMPDYMRYQFAVVGLDETQRLRRGINQ